MINTLRRAVGQEELNIPAGSDRSYNTAKEKWVTEKKLVNTINISVMLNDGEQPIHEVLSAINKLNDDELLKVIAPFIPAPLIDKSLSMGFNHWLHQKSENEYWIYFCR